MLAYTVYPIYYLFSMLKIPNGHFFRYSFLYSFLIIYVAGIALDNVEIDIRTILYSTILLSALTLFAFFYKKETGILLQSAVTVVSGIAIYFLYAEKKSCIRAMALIALSLGSLAEHGYDLFIEFQDHNYQFNSIQQYDKYLENMISQIKLSDNSVYRFDKTGTRFNSFDKANCNVESLPFGFSSISNYVSTGSTRTGSFFINMGYGSKSSVRLYDPLNMFDSLLGIKYVASALNSLPGYEKTDECIVNGIPVNIFNNPNACSLGFAISTDLHEEFTENPFENQQLVLNAVSGIEKKFYSNATIIEKESNSIFQRIWEVKINESGPLYIWIKNGNEAMTLSIDGKTFPTNKSWFGNQIYYVADYETGDTIEIISDSIFSSFYNLYAVTVNQQDISQLYSVINSKSVLVNSASRRKIIMETEQSCNTSVCLTIPFEKGWSVFVNGEKTDYIPFADAFISFSVPSGHSEIEMEYRTPGLVWGIFISFFSIIVFCQYEWLFHKPQS